ncbi:hypothetical protein M2169_004319 [Streptomyces sp. MJP52]|nr:hypothetical protein [Streptomyces sp. MJP52]
MAEAAHGEQQLVAATHQVELLADRAGERDAPDQRAVLGGAVLHRPFDPGGDLRAKIRVHARHAEGGQVVRAARVPAEVRDGVDGQDRGPLVEDLGLLRGEHGQPGVGGGVRHHPGGQQHLGAVAVQGETEQRRAHPVGGGGAGLGGETDRGAPQQGLHLGEFPVPAGGGRVEPVGRHRHPGQPAQQRPQRAGGLPFRREQPAQVAAQHARQGEEGEGLGGRREVGDQHVVGAGERRRAQVAQQSELPGAGQRGELVALQRARAQQVQGGAGPLLEGPQRVPEPPVGVGRAHREAGNAVGQETGRQGVVAGQQQGAGALAGGAQGGGRGDGGAAGAAGPGDQYGPHRRRGPGS